MTGENGVGPADPVDDGFGPVSYEALSRIQRIAGARLHSAWSSIPHVTHFEDADVTGIDIERRRLKERDPGSRLTLLAWVAHATVRAMREFPRFSASFDPEGHRLVLKRYLNLGIAVQTPVGLVVAVVHEAGGMTLEQIGASITDLADRGRTGKLKPTEMEGSCLTISSLGGLGGTGFTPIINPPDVAILGLCPARLRPACVDGRIEPRLILPMSLSYDHRVLDGADAARFCTFLREQLAEGAT